MANNMHIRNSACTIPSYEDALKALFNLQSNNTYLRLVQNNIFYNDNKLSNTTKYLSRSGISVEELDNLSVIHVAGTKGKGSTCAFTEAILCKHGYRTGFFSSPHLITVRERLRLNGIPISEKDFAYYFWELYKKLNDAKENESDMPTYFNFLTILMFNIFLAANVEVAIIEVGIGGELDSTNIVRKPVCVGITSLALDHTSLLGNTIEEIAYQKSGIFKPNTVAFTVPQLDEAMRVLEKRAIEKNCTLHVIPKYQSYTWGNVSQSSELTNPIKQQNASLAIQLAIQWIKSKSIKENVTDVLASIGDGKQCSNFQENKETTKYIFTNILKHDTFQKTNINTIVSFEKIAMALSICAWPGRMQILKGTSVDFYLDGAHTLESMNCCISWFTNATTANLGKRLLIFNMSGNRDSTKLLMRLKSLNFDKVYFVPNTSGLQDIDNQLNAVNLKEQQMKCKIHSEIWGKNSAIANNVADVLYDIKKECTLNNCTTSNEKAQILVTGSLHLVGALLAVLDPNFTMRTKFV